MNLKIIKKINFFVENFSETFLINLSKHLEEKKIGPEEILFSKDDLSDTLFILNSGDISIYIELSNTKEKNIKVLETLKVFLNFINFRILKHYLDR
jgi:CRP-like cAMP-binding protein